MRKATLMQNKKPLAIISWSSFVTFVILKIKNCFYLPVQNKLRKWLGSRHAKIRINMKSLKNLRSHTKIVFRNKIAFWVGFLSVSAGVALQLPMYINASGMGYRLVGMHMSTTMDLGMGLVVLGLFTTLYSLIPPTAAMETGEYNLKVRALDDAPINWTHVGLLAVMAIAITLDVMKPTILSFVVPGMEGNTDLN